MSKSKNRTVCEYKKKKKISRHTYQPEALGLTPECNVSCSTPNGLQLCRKGIKKQKSKSKYAVG